jgi:spore coat polysaccharide biosynthesis protein SpsF
VKDLIVVQARVGSSRLPGKVLLDVLGEPLLARQLERIQRATVAAEIVVATTTAAEDDAIVALCNRLGVTVYRGHPTDLLDRHYQAASRYGAEVVAKIPSDCPLIDPGIIDKVFGRLKEGDYDYASNLHPPSFPDGNDVEVMSTAALRSAWLEAKLPMEREHTTPFIWERPQRFAIANVVSEEDRDYSMSHRWTLDYPEDYAFVRRVYEELYPANKAFTLDDIFALLALKPEVHAINAKYAGVNWYRHHLHELVTIDPSQTRSI